MTENTKNTKFTKITAICTIIIAIIAVLFYTQRGCAHSNLGFAYKKSGMYKEANEALFGMLRNVKVI